MRRRSRAALLGAVLSLAALTGCVSVATSGPIERVEGPPPACQSCVNVEVAPPAAGASPAEVVAGFLAANSNYQPNYATAKQFLTQAAAAKWTPDVGATIYTGRPSTRRNVVTFVGRQVGSLGAEGTFTAMSSELKVNFGVVREGREWRINEPLPGLMVTQEAFSRSYKSYDLYFVGADQVLVPEPVYVPDLRAPSNFASLLVSALLQGPSSWLKRAVQTAAPPGTTLSADSVTISNGVASVPLSEEVRSLGDAERDLLMAQLVYTLRQVTGVKKVLLLAGAQPVRVTGSEPETLALPVDAVPDELAHDPIPFVASEDVYAVSRRRVVERVPTNTDTLVPEKLPGALGGGRYRVDALAVSVDGRDLAVVTDRRTILRRGSTAGGAATPVLGGVTDLLRPQFTRSGELLVVGRQRGRQQMWAVTPAGTSEVSAPALWRRGEVTAFRVSPDGTRMAVLLRRKGGEAELGLARITRSDSVTVEGYRARDLAFSGAAVDLSQMQDVAWTDATTLVVLGAKGGGSPFAPVEISADASQVKPDPETNDWDGLELAVLLRTRTTIVRAQGGRTFRDSGTDWEPFVTGVTAIAYPG